MLALIVVSWGFLLRVGPASAGTRASGGRGHAEVPQRHDGRSCRAVGGTPVTWVFSLDVVQPGSACPRGAGRPAPTAFNRAGEKLRATGGELPRVTGGVGPRRRDGLALPLIREEGLGRVAGAGWKRWSGGLRRAAGGAGGGGGIPAGVVDDQEVDPAQQGGSARDAGLGALRAGRGGRRADLPRSRIGRRRCGLRGVIGGLVIAWYLAAMTGLNWSIGHTARQTVSRRPGRPRREMCASPKKAPEALSDGDSPACLTTDDELS